MYNKDFDSLNAGAPDIRLSGNQQMASYGYDDAMAETFQMYLDGLKDGTVPIDMEFDEFLQLLPDQSKAPQQNQRMASAVGDESDEISMGLFGKPVKELTPPELQELQEEIDRLQQKFMAQGGRAGIMAAAPGTYSQRRKQMMAGGGIAGLKQIGKPGGLVEPGISKYGMFDFITEPLGKLKDKFVDDIIPNEIKENPLATAALIGGGINQFGIPGMDGAGQNWLGELLGKDLVFGPGGEQFGTTITNPQQLGDLEKAAQVISQPGSYFGGDYEGEAYGTKSIADYIKEGVLGPQIKEKSLYDRFTDTLGNVFSDTTRDGQTFNWKIPVAAGIAAGKYTAGQPRDTLPMDQTGINFQTAQEAMDDPNLRFKPKLEDTQLAAQGGRIGYDNGGSYEAKVQELMDLGMSREMAENLLIPARSHYGIEDKAQGGRIGYGKGGDIMKGIAAGLSPELSLDTWKSWKKLKDDGYEMSFSDYLDGEMFSQGGRVPAQEGGLMNLGGMEKDYRNEGGFVPIGGKEKADDVPARLSKNEFVFTADAVRGAGGGDIDKGAEIMENMMNHLEAGGEVSEDSQGLEGARGMFANAQQLQKRII